MIEEVLKPDLRASEDFDVQFTIRLPRDVARQLLVAAEARRVDAGPLASAIVGKAFGAELHVPQRAVRKQARLSQPEVRADIRKMHAAGLTVAEIAANLDAKRSTVQAWCDELELEFAGPRVASPRHPKGGKAGVRPFSNSENVRTFLRMYRHGATDGAIAEAIGCSSAAVTNQRKMRGLLPTYGVAA